MDLLKAALEKSPGGHTKQAAVKHLAGLLGLQGRSNEVLTCLGHAALFHGDFSSGLQTCLQVIKLEYVPSWRLCAAVMKAGGDSVGNLETHTRLLSFAACFARGKRVSLACTACCVALSLAANFA